MIVSSYYPYTITPGYIQTTPGVISPLGTAANRDPMIITSDSDNYYNKNWLYDPIQSFIRSVPYNPRPFQSIAPILNIDDNADLRDKMTKYFYEKTFNNWLYGDLNDVLQYLVIKGNKVVLVSSSGERDKNTKDTIESMDKKIDFIIENVFTKYDMKSFLKKFVLKSGVRWIDLKIHKDGVKDAIYKKIKYELKRKV